jgi:hypothetical protein
MTKDTQLTLRIRSDLKKQLESVAEREGRSVAQVCEVFLEAGFENYKKEGTKLLQRFLTTKSQHPRTDKVVCCEGISRLASWLRIERFRDLICTRRTLIGACLRESAGDRGSSSSKDVASCVNFGRLVDPPHMDLLFAFSGLSDVVEACIRMRP